MMRLRFYLIASFLTLSIGVGCSILQVRPSQEMSDTAAALRAAKEVQSEVLSPELYRKANEWFSRARVEYRLKNFSNAKEFADLARKYAEQAEFESIRNGASRESIAPPILEEAPAPSPYEYPEPTGIPASQYEKRIQSGNSQPVDGTTPIVPPPAPF